MLEVKYEQDSLVLHNQMQKAFPLGGTVCTGTLSWLLQTVPQNWNAHCSLITKYDSVLYN